MKPLHQRVRDYFRLARQFTNLFWFFQLTDETRFLFAVRACYESTSYYLLALSESSKTTSVYALRSSKHKFTARACERVRWIAPAGIVNTSPGFRRNVRPSARSISRSPSTTRKHSSERGCWCQRNSPCITANRTQ